MSWSWRRWFGFDPAGKTGVVVVHQLRAGGEIRVDAEQLRRSAASGLRSRSQVFDALERQLAEYEPPNREGNPLPDKESKTLHHGLHLDDYQPRSHEHGVQRVTFERAFPPPPEQWSEDMWLRQRPHTGWVGYRNRSPLEEGPWILPPMRDALADLIEHLHMVHAKLAEQDLVAVEVSVQHEPTPSREDGSGQGWNFAVHVVAVPQAVLDEEQRRFDERRAAEVAPKPL